MEEGDGEVIRRCLNAAANGPFFSDSEFHTLFGLERWEVAMVLDAWPTPVDTKNPRWPEQAPKDVQDRAVKNAMNHLLGFPHGHDGAWTEYIPVSQREVAMVLQRWRGDDRFDPTGKGYFDRLA